MAKKQRIVIIGVGGIGKALLPTLSMYLNYDDSTKYTMVLVDGDTYEPSNANRQSFGESQMRWFLEAARDYMTDEAGLEMIHKAEEQILGLGNKAEVSARRLRDQFRNLSFEVIPAFLAGPDDEIQPGQDVRQIAEVLQEGDIVFSCVDNHKTRLNLSQHAQSMRDVKIFTGSNDLVNGHVYLFVRRKGKNLFQPIEEVHQEIKQAKTAKAPHEMSCEELAVAGGEQIVITNAAAANEILKLFYAEQQRKNSLNEVLFCIQAFGNTQGPATVSFTHK